MASDTDFYRFVITELTGVERFSKSYTSKNAVSNGITWEKKSRNRGYFASYPEAQYRIQKLEAVLEGEPFQLEEGGEWASELKAVLRWVDYV